MKVTGREVDGLFPAHLMREVLFLTRCSTQPANLIAAEKK
jgi:hypothetical protein